MEPMQEDAKLQAVVPIGVELNGHVPVEGGISAQKASPIAGQGEMRTSDSSASSNAKPLSARSGAEIALRFHVDPQTHEVTVFVLDKTHRHVIRTIPPEEMARLRAGEIIDLFV
jgi:hypothetical protein